MAVKRDADGNVVDVGTRPVGGAGGGGRPGRGRGMGARTVVLGASGGSAGDRGRHDTPTVRLGESKQGHGAARTVVIGAGVRGGTVVNAGAAADDPMQDPPVGWLVIVRGPGRGVVATLGTGRNTIGRGAESRIRLDYGDTTISREHTVIVYEPRQRNFHLLPGDGRNLTYVDDEPVLETRELAGLEQLQVGDTVLRFVPLCGDGFSWDEEEAGES